MEALRILIRNTEAASIELVPTEEGVELVVLRREKEKPQPSKDNLEILREFCTGKKNRHKGDKTILADLKRFWAWYSPKMEDWKGTVDCEKLWTRWSTTRVGNPVDYE